MASAESVTWYAQLSRWQALGVLVLTAAAIVWCIVAASARELLPSTPPSNRSDLRLYRQIVDRVHGGESYYDAAGSELRAMGYPTRSIFNWRPPTYAWLNGYLPTPLWGKTLLILIAGVTLLMAGDFLLREGGLPRAVTNGLLLVGAFVWCLGPDNCLETELWSGILIALSVCAFARDLWLLGVAAGLFALFFRELALPYCVVSLGLALGRKRRPETVAWVVGLVLYALFMTYHGFEVARRITPADLAHKHGWIGFGGTRFLLATAQMNFLLVGLPDWCTAIYLPLSVLGMAGWRGTTGLRIALTTGAYLAAFSVVGMPINFYWGLMFAPLLTFGAARAPISLREVIGSIRHPPLAGLPSAEVKV